MWVFWCEFFEILREEYTFFRPLSEFLYARAHENEVAWIRNIIQFVSSCLVSQKQSDHCWVFPTTIILLLSSIGAPSHYQSDTMRCVLPARRQTTYAFASLGVTAQPSFVYACIALLLGLIWARSSCLGRSVAALVSEYYCIVDICFTTRIWNSCVIYVHVKPAV